MNQTDTSVIPGMNLPHRLISTKVMAGLGQDETLELTLFKSGVNIMRISDHVQELGRQTRRRGSHILHLCFQTEPVTLFLVETGQKTSGFCICNVTRDLTPYRVLGLAKHLTLGLLKANVT